jgi:hypothetical protein
VTGTNTWQRGWNTTLKISVSNLLAAATDADSNTLTLIEVQQSTNGVTPTFDSNYLYYTNVNNVDDRFTYVISDGQPSGVSTGLVIVQISQATATNTVVSLQTHVPGPNSNTVTLVGVPGYQYWVQFATNLTTSPWFPLQLGTAGANGLWMVIDPTATNSQRYYRSSYP